MSRAGSSLLLALACSAIVAGAGAAPPAAPLPGPAPQGRAPGHDAAAENRACESCHADVAAEWSASLHHRAWDDPVFLTAYAVEPIAFCRGCHAPEADPTHTPPEPARRLGVGCVTCHVVGGEVVGARGRVSEPAGRVGHAVRGDARMATAAACERCHQFDFPRPQAAPMQGTADEHRASAHAAQSCQACHMPLVRDAQGRARHRHDFRVSGDVAMLRSAVTARAWRSGPDEISVALATARVGHAFPTGDLFRRLEVRARVAGEGGPSASPVVLARRFTMVRGPGGPQRVQTGDDRLPATGEERVLRLRFAETVSARAVRWEVVYQRMDAGMAVAFGVDPAADEVIVAGGALAPPAGGVDER